MPQSGVRIRGPGLAAAALRSARPAPPPRSPRLPRLPLGTAAFAVTAGGAFSAAVGTLLADTGDVTGVDAQASRSDSGETNSARRGMTPPSRNCESAPVVRTCDHIDPYPDTQSHARVQCPILPQDGAALIVCLQCKSRAYIHILLFCSLYP